MIRGRVQGVWFRSTCAREASDRGVSGWVRNRDDGSVEALFEGRPEGVAAMVDWCRRGPSAARVDEIVVVEEEPTGRSGFAIVG